MNEVTCSSRFRNTQKNLQIVYDINTGIVTNVFPVNPNNGIPDVELDTTNMRIYWTEFSNGQIQSADYDASGNLSNITTELSGLANPFGLALG